MREPKHRNLEGSVTIPIDITFDFNEDDITESELKECIREELFRILSGCIYTVSSTDEWSFDYDREPYDERNVY